MFALSGILSARLRRAFGPDVEEWPKHREPEAKRDMREEHYAGVTLGARYRHIGQHRP